MDAKKLSAAIRAKKKAMLEADPEMIGTKPGPDMNAQDIHDLTQKARIEKSLDVPDKINADDKNLDQPVELEQEIGLTPEQKTRMPRLKAYLDSMDM